MNIPATTAIGLLFALFVCISAAHALLAPWLQARRASQMEKPVDEPRCVPLPHGAFRPHTA